MKHLGNLAVIGTGASTIYLLAHIERNAESLRAYIDSITLFEKSGIAGCGMPYSPETTDRFNMSNISSEEIPPLPETLYDWLASQDGEQLRNWRIDPDDLDESEVYPRLPLGRYLHTQFKSIITSLVEKGIPVSVKTNREIIDIAEDTARHRIILTDGVEKRLPFHSVIIATGHQWSEEDRPENGYFGSPWPIFKLLPEEGGFHDFPVGTLGASLSAFDVVSSLAHRHGTFSEKENGDLTYHPHPGTEKFRLRMHSAKGWLPHLQFDQEEPFREIYRHTDRGSVFGMLDGEGFLRISTFFNEVCRPALSRAFKKDGMPEMVGLLRDPDFGLEEFVAKMSEHHSYDDAFEGMRREMAEARESVLNHKPIHWKEVIDDLMYSLNFHAEMMPAEDHLTLKKVVMPFLMNVIAAMPLPSGKLLLALYDAGVLELVPGYVSVDEKQEEAGRASVTVTHGGKTTTAKYGIFIDCSGQKPLDLAHYPFQSLVEDGNVRRARAIFIDPDEAAKLAEDGKADLVFQNDTHKFLHTGGIEIDAAYRVVSHDDVPNDHIYDLAFPHTSGVRPYSYGLQACDATAGIVVGSWLRAIGSHSPVPGNPAAASEIYEKI